jgi:hypothetical protein
LSTSFLNSLNIDAINTIVHVLCISFYNFIWFFTFDKFFD